MSESIRAFQKLNSKKRLAEGPKKQGLPLSSNFASKEEIAELRRIILQFIDDISFKHQTQSNMFNKSVSIIESSIEDGVTRKLRQLKINLPVQRQLSIPVSIDEGGTGATTAAQAAINLGIATSNTVYFGDANTNGSWRITTSGNNLVIERRESGSWVEKGAFLAS